MPTPAVSPCANRASASSLSGECRRGSDAAPSSRTGAVAGHRLARAANHRQRLGDVLERLALGVDAEGRLDHTTDHHHAGAEQVDDEQRGAVGAVADYPAVDDRAESTEALSDREEHGNRLRPDLEWK